MFSTWLCDTRRALGLTQGELAEAVGVSPSTVGMWERGLRLPGTKAAVRLAGWMAARGAAVPPRPWRLGPPQRELFRQEVAETMRGGRR